MVLTARASLTPALVVPDEQTWTALGVDPARLGVEPVFEPRAARRLLVPERLPDELAKPLAALVAGLPADVRPEQHPLPLVDEAIPGAAPATPSHENHGAHEQPSPDHADRSARRHDTDSLGDHHAASGHEMHGGGHDMMAIVGEPSADGLVMEPIELRFGPLATPLPCGLIATVTLDGDVVAESIVETLFQVESSADSRPTPPDPLSRRAWTTVISAAAEAADGSRVSTRSRWLRVAAVELERTVSHLAWLRSFGRLLGWGRLVDACTSALGVLHEPHGSLASGGRETEGAVPTSAVAKAVHVACTRTDAVVGLVGGRWFGVRTAGRGVLTAMEVRDRGLSGPVARACGLPDDVRADDPLYRELGFQPVVHPDGDARARAIVRAQEARGAVGLAAGALRAVSAGASVTSPPHAVGPHALVEGPRGPLRARRDHAGWSVAAPGAGVARDVAAAAMVGHEWASALVVLGSFDLSPWELER